MLQWTGDGRSVLHIPILSPLDMNPKCDWCIFASFIINFLEVLHTVSHNGYTIFHSYQQGAKFQVSTSLPTSINFHFTTYILTGVSGVSPCSLICILLLPNVDQNMHFHIYMDHFQVLCVRKYLLKMFAHFYLSYLPKAFFVFFFFFLVWVCLVLILFF